ncbi:Uncharacterised protein [Burkholderia pseudomallei]|nr:hypothetical protein BIM11_2214 [Burkholderia pseudomallei]CAJ3109615.1 Uncharacterised protein [Burkholderia pseudomallei]CAJ3802399.1 Uncharacterised protein [Burkholderia pseudomallei]CAJ4239420.1 Uncharacterised protein [Burkholderia pseudomallei]CAJ4259256.1 Uncharacterised protein [Burkholderia pseudomallei]
MKSELKKKTKTKAKAEAEAETKTKTKTETETETETPPARRGALDRSERPATNAARARYAPSRRASSCAWRISHASVCAMSPGRRGSLGRTM